MGVQDNRVRGWSVWCVAIGIVSYGMVVFSTLTESLSIVQRIMVEPFSESATGGAASRNAFGKFRFHLGKDDWGGHQLELLACCGAA